MGEEEEEEEEGEFRLYSCINNDVKMHCVEFEDDPNGKRSRQNFVKLPLYLRPAIDLLIVSFPKGQTVRKLVEECGQRSESMVTMPEMQEFVKLLHEMQLVKLT